MAHEENQDVDPEEKAALLEQNGGQDDEVQRISNKSKTSKRLRNIWSILLRLCVAFLVTWAVIDIAIRTYTAIKAPPKTCYCGKTPEDAIQMGCTYDHIAGAWLPRHCYDEGLVRIFENPERVGNHNWTYTAWNNTSVELSIQDVSKHGCIPQETEDSEARCAVGHTTDWHMTHCLYLWWKLVRSRSNGIVMSERYVDEDHVGHCIRMIMDQLEGTKDYNEIAGLTYAWMFQDHFKS